MNSTGLLIMYKIYSKDGKYMYVNSTKNFEARKQWHKEIYLEEEDPWNKTLLYKTIRENGGWDNFIIEPIEYGYFDDIEKVIKREIFWIEELKSNMHKFSYLGTWTIHNYTFMVLDNNTDKHMKIKRDCKCGRKYSENTIQNHMKTKKHKQYEIQNSNDDINNLINEYNIKQFDN